MVSGLNHVTFSVADLDRAFSFYTDILGLRPVARWYRGAYLLAGDVWICLTHETNVDRAIQKTYDHVAFTVTPQAFTALSARIIDSNIEIWQPNPSEGESLYFLDPDGHRLEIHASDLLSRLLSLQRMPPRDLVLFESEPFV